jgi:hypothetical protein
MLCKSPETPAVNPEAIQSLTVNPADELLTVADLATILKCKESSIYNLTRRRGRARYDNPVPVLRLPMGLRFRRESVMAWLRSQETTDAA